MRSPGNLDRLCERLDYRFEREDLLRQALTHRSARGEHNERLEFLGDSVLNFCVAAELFQRFPKAREGDLSRLRARLVRQDTLADRARHWGLGDWLVLGPGELKSGGFRRDSILADAVEAVLGAIYLDGGLESCRRVILDLFDDWWGRLSSLDALKDPKTRLQEWLQGRSEPLPVYTLVRQTGKAHEQHFEVICEAAGAPRPGRGDGRSRREAEQAAALEILRMLGAWS